MVSNEFSCIGKGFKHFIGLICGEKKIMYTTSKKCVDAKSLDETKWMSFLIKDKMFFNKIWNKISIIMQKWVDKETVCDRKYLNTKKYIASAEKIFILKKYYLK